VGDDYGCIKYSNGMMECWNRRVKVTRASNGRMDGYYVFPSEFTEIPTITFSLDLTEGVSSPTVFMLTAPYIRELYTDRAQLAISRITGQTNFDDGDWRYVHVHARGRWR